MSKINLTSRFVNRPIFVSEACAEVMVHEQRVEIENLSAEMDAMWSEVRAGNRKPYQMNGNVAVIPVNGTLVHKINWSGYGYTGYDFIGSMIDHALADPDVKGIALDIDSGGGEVDGAFEMADKIRAAANEKPVLSMVNAHAYSAAYLLASAGSKISVPKTGGVGSIGVVTMHADYSKALEDFGMKITMIYKGKHKVDGNPYEPLPAKVRSRIESRLDSTYNLFVDTVANNRSMSTQSVRDTEALTYGAEEALSIGLVDVVASPKDALAAFVAELNGSKRGSNMNLKAENLTAEADQRGNADAASGLEVEKLVTAAKADGMTEGAAAERARIMGIIKCEEAQGRAEMALVLCDQGLSVEQAKTILAAAPKAQETASVGTFTQAMANTANPEMSGSEGDQAEVPAWKKALNSYSAASGMKFDNLN